MAEAAAQQQLTVSYVAVILAGQAPISPACARPIEGATSGSRRSAGWLLMAVAAIPLAVRATTGPRRSSPRAEGAPAGRVRATAEDVHRDRLASRPIRAARAPARSTSVLRERRSARKSTPSRHRRPLRLGPA